MTKKRNCPYCNVTTFRFKKGDTKFVCVKCKGVVLNERGEEKNGDL